jgi:hypothetical protein
MAHQKNQGVRPIRSNPVFVRSHFPAAFPAIRPRTSPNFARGSSTGDDPGGRVEKGPDSAPAFLHFVAYKCRECSRDGGRSGGGLGAQHALTPRLSIGGAYAFVWIGDMSVDQERGPLAGRVAGEYKSSNMSVFALNMIWKY